jgi:hypothetical protein
MNRAVVLGTLLIFGALAVTSVGLQAQRGPAEPTPAGIEGAKIEKVKDNLYMIGGSAVGDAFTGGNVAVFITDPAEHTLRLGESLRDAWRHGGCFVRAHHRHTSTVHPTRVSGCMP